MTDTPYKIIRIHMVLDLTGLSRSTMYRKIAAGSFPRPIKIANRCAGWLLSAVTDWQRDPLFYDATH